MTRTALDLFCGLGGFSAAFDDNDDWEVVTVDIEERFGPDIQADVMDLRPKDLPDADVVLVGQPCTLFSPARNITEGGDGHWHGNEPASDKARLHVALVYHTIGIVKALAPEFWFLENPIGRLRTVLGQPTGTITQCQYGRVHQKPTDLWGEHPPMTYRRCSPGAPCHEPTGSYSADEPQPRLGTLSESDDPAERAKVPYELSESIREAIEEAYANPPPEQTTLTAIEGVVGR